MWASLEKYVSHRRPAFIFTARCTIVQSARSCDRMSSVCDVGGSGAYRLEISETNCTDN